MRYYATDQELQNCGINAEEFRSEKPFTTAWALYHKMLGDGFFRREELAPEYAEYGHAVEPYGVRVLQRGRTKRLVAGEVYISDRLISSLDISGTAEEIDEVPFDYGTGKPRKGQKFVCEQKSMNPMILKKGLPFKYIIQAQYQILQTKADFFILQIMVLKDDTVFNRGRITQMSPKKKYQYLDENMTVIHKYFQNNMHLSVLIDECLKRFFSAVDNGTEPKPYLEHDSQQNIIESICLNAMYNDKLICDYDLTEFHTAKKQEEQAEMVRKRELQKIIEFAKENNACRFRSNDGASASFDKRGRLLYRPPEVVSCS